MVHALPNPRKLLAVYPGRTPRSCNTVSLLPIFTMPSTTAELLRSLRGGVDPSQTFKDLAFPCECLSSFTLRQIAQSVCAGTNEVLQSIKEYIVHEQCDEMKGLLLQHAFSLNVVLQSGVQAKAGLNYQDKLHILPSWVLGVSSQD